MKHMKYNRPGMSYLDVKVGSQILSGSNNDAKVDASVVTVANYSAGFEEEGNDFKEISFD